MKDRITYLFAAWLLVVAALAFLLIHQRAEVLRLRDELLAKSATIATFGDANERLSEDVSDCQTTRAAIQKTANLCGAGWDACEKRWGGMEWR